MSNRIQILLHASYFSPNFGDVLLWRITLNLAKQAFPDAEFLTANLPSGMVEIYDPKFETRSLALHDKPDITIFAGGGYFCPPAHGHIKWHIRNYLRHQRALKVAALSNRVVFLGVGFGSLGHSPLGRAIGSIPQQNVSVALLRDVESLEHFKNYCRASEASTCHDLAFSYLSANSHKWRKTDNSPDILGCPSSGILRQKAA